MRHLKFKENGILLNGTHATVRRQVTVGDILDLALENDEGSQSLTPTEIALDVIYEDSDVAVPSKPANMPTHPSHNHHGDTLADALAFRYRNDKDPFVFRPINRLDRNTSGLTLIARNRISAARLSESMRDGKIKKLYVAVLDGVLADDVGSIETYMCRTDTSIIVRRVCSVEDGGDYALTRYRVICRSEDKTLVLASPETGRTHQLRVHFAHLGCSILGDDMYGKSSLLIDRHALHAIRLGFVHPTDSREMSLYAPLPPDMESAVRLCFGEGALDVIEKATELL